MNRIFKNIWSKSLGCMVVVSEKAKSAGKNDNTTGSVQQGAQQSKRIANLAFKPLLLKSLVISITAISGSNVWAGSIIQRVGCPTNNMMPAIFLDGGNAIAFPGAIPYSAYTSLGENVAIGGDCNNLTWALSNAVAIGGAAASTGGVAIGTAALAYQENSIAIGNQAKANGINSIALGANSIADRENSFSIGSASLQRQMINVAAPTKATEAANKGYVDTAITNFTGNADSVLYDTASNKATLTLAGASGTKITNLQDATLDANSTDAVIGKQLFATKTTAIQALDTAQKGLKVRSNTGAEDTLALGDTLTFTNGSNTIVEYDAATNQIKTNLVAAPVFNGQVTATSFKAGNVLIDGTTNKISGVADGQVNATSTDAVTGKQLFNTNQNLTNLDTRVGTNETAITGIGTRFTAVDTRIDDVDTRIDGVDNTISGIDGRVTANKGDIASLQSGLGIISTNAVVYDNAAKDQLTLAGASGTKITNLQDATLNANSTDAVTGKQLFATKTTAIQALDTAQKGLKVRSNTGVEDTLALGDTLTFANGSNTTVEYDATTKQIKTNLVAAPVFSGQVTATSFKTGNVLIDGTTNKISGLADGGVSATSTDAVTGKQLFNTNQSVTNLDTRVGSEVSALNTRIGNEVGTLNSTINGIDGRVTANRSDIASLQSGLGGLSGNAVIYDANTNKGVISLAGATGTKITNLQDAALTNASTDAVTGKQLNATNTVVATKAAQSDLIITNSNLSTLDSQVNHVSTGLASKASQTDFNTLTGRVSTTEADISGLDGRVGSN